MKAKRDGIVEISGAEYTLEYIKDLKNPHGDDLWGHYKAHTGQILIEADQPAKSQRNTLIHEIVHGILEHAGMGDIPDNEKVVGALAYGLESVKINGRKLLR